MFNFVYYVSGICIILFWAFFPQEQVIAADVFALGLVLWMMCTGVRWCVMSSQRLTRQCMHSRCNHSKLACKLNQGAPIQYICPSKHCWLQVALAGLAVSTGNSVWLYHTSVQCAFMGTNWESGARPLQHLDNDGLHKPPEHVMKASCRRNVLWMPKILKKSYWYSSFLVLFSFYRVWSMTDA